MLLPSKFFLTLNPHPIRTLRISRSSGCVPSLAGSIVYKGVILVGLDGFEPSTSRLSDPLEEIRIPSRHCYLGT